MNSKTYLALVVTLVFVGCQGAKFPEVITSCAPSPASIVTTVTSLLDGADYVEALKGLAAKEGVETIACAVNYVRDQYLKPGASEFGTVGAVRLGRAEEFLRETGTRFEGK